MNPYKDVEESFSAESRLEYADIATKLLKDQYFLTALELHTELVENGKELPQLREFFSNPGNFEQHVSRASDLGSIHRTPSQATLDSLDIARYSEDGGGDRAGSGGDVAVLEFELRKAKETINVLRANLTQFADGDTALDKNVKENSERSLKPHEKKALNFLINEYLLLQDYKLTSITFSDENPDQEFEDWDDVGLNMPRPPGLLSLFWGNSSANVPKVDSCTTVDLHLENKECQTDFDSSICVNCQGALDHDADWNHELLIQAEEIELLKQKIVGLETEKLNFQKLYDAAIVSLNSLTSPTSESKGLELQIPEEKILGRLEQSDRPLTLTAMENHYGSGQSTHSATPEQFEMIESDKNSAMDRKLSSNTSSFDPAHDNSVRNSPMHQGSVTTLDETMSINDNGDWTRVQFDYTVVESCKEMWIDSPVPTTLKESLLTWCSEIVVTNELQSIDLLSDLVNSDKPITLPGLLILVADSLPRIIPHTLVARRIEFVPLLAAAAALLPAGDARRGRTLLALLTLVKKPEKNDTVAICEAASLIVKWGGGGELLSTIAELLASKSSERRILASQICVYIAPYITLELCTSLLFSVVTLMCESSESEVRNCGLKAACLICPVADNKYGQLKNMMFSFLKDPNEKVVKETVKFFVPVLARSALLAGKYATDLYKQIQSNFTKACTNEDWKTVILYTNLFQALVLVNVAYVVNVQIVKDNSYNCDTDYNLDEVPLKSENNSFIDLNCYVIENTEARSLIVGVNNVLKQEPQVRWCELNWFIEILKQVMKQATSSKLLNHPTIYENLISLFSSYVRNFGSEFSMKILKPIFMETITDLEQKMEKLHTVNVEITIVVGIYLVTILPVHEDVTVRDEFLQKWIVYSSIRSLPVKLFSIPLKWVASNRSDTLDFYLQHLREFAATSCESTTGSTIRIYIASLLTELLNLAEVTERCIEKQVLPAVMALLHDDEVTVREAALSTWGSLTRSVVLRKLSCTEQCYNALEGSLAEGLSGKEGARAAESLAIILLTMEGQAGCERAAMLVCQLCNLAALSGEFVAAISRALQLAHRSAPQCPALLPAVLKLEEAVQTPFLIHFKPTIDALLHSVSGTQDQPRLDSTPRSSTNLQTAQEVGRRVSQIFQQSKTNMNLQNIFKKK